MSRLYRLLLAAAVTFGAALPARADDPETGEVTGVTVKPAPGRADIVIGIRGAVEVRDFLLTNPDRLVLDFRGARLSGDVALYDGVTRAGVTNIRYSQFRPEVVRVVLDLDGPKEYQVERTDDAVRVSFGAERTFLSWSSSASDSYARGPARGPAPTTGARDRGPEVDVAPRVTRAPEPRITVTWDRASIADVVAGFAAFSGRTIILGKGISGEVTAEIKNQPWPQAFQAVLAAQGLSVQEMPSGILRVDAPATLAALDSLEPLETRVVRINYAEAGSLAKTVESILTQGRGRVVADTGSNALIITDTRSRIAGVTEFVEGLDIRTPQISIQAKIIFVDRTDLEALGVKYDIGSQTQFFNSVVQRCCDPATGEPFLPPQNIVDLGGNSLAAVGNASANIASSALDLIFSTTIGGFSVTSFLSALEQVELSDVQAEPIITTLDNRQADILVGEETPVRVIDASSQGAGGAPRATVQFKETGIRLTVTPHVTNNRQILMDLHTERSAIQILPEADLGFIFQKQKADNQLLVNDGETAVIGGLTVTQVTRNRSGIPLLSGLPIIGNLFSFTSNEEQRRDLIILVTPRIIDDGMTPP